MSKYGDYSGPYFSVFGLNTGKYGLEKNPYLVTFHTMELELNFPRIFVFSKCMCITDMMTHMISNIFDGKLSLTES